MLLQARRHDVNPVSRMAAVLSVQVVVDDVRLILQRPVRQVRDPVQEVGLHVPHHVRDRRPIP